MNEFNRKKVTGVRWLKKPVDDIQIIVRLKPQDGILSLPKFEDYANESSNLSLQQMEHKSQEYTFKWQEKVFSSWELQRYSDEHNCISETELSYHEMINNLNYEPSKVFSYIHTDYHLPLPMEVKKKADVPEMNSWFKKLSLVDKMGSFLEDTNSTGRLFRSTENIVNDEEEWTAMHIVYDNSEYNEDSQLLLKQEATIVSLYHNIQHNYLIISPDVNDLEFNPYTLETATGVTWGYQYSVHLGFEERSNGEELVTLLRKLHKKCERQKKQVLNFEMPPLGRKQFFLTLEILTASDFDEDNLYIEFNIKIPEEYQCKNVLHSRTHVTTPVRGEDIEQWHFGHLIELTVEMATGSDLSPLNIFFEVISTDWWGRHRTEGYTFLPLQLQPGYYMKQLSCSRPEEINDAEAESRRFFVGGCHLIKNLEVLAKPQLIDANFKFTTTGHLNLRWSVISQASLPGSHPKRDTHGASASALLLGAEAVLQQYKKARARLAAATEGLSRGEPG